MYEESLEDKIEHQKANLARRIIECLDAMELDGSDISVKTTLYTNPNYYTIEVSDKKENIIAINIHKLKK